MSIEIEPFINTLVDAAEYALRQAGHKDATPVEIATLAASMYVSFMTQSVKPQLPPVHINWPIHPSQRNEDYD